MPLWVVRSIQDSWDIATLSAAEFEQRIRQRGVFRDPARTQAATEEEINRLLQSYWDFRINAKRRKNPEDYIFGLEASPNHLIPLSDHRLVTAATAVVPEIPQDSILSDEETLSVLGIEWGQLGNYSGPVLRMRSSFVALKTPMRRWILTERHLSDSSGLYVTIGSVENPARQSDGRRDPLPIFRPGMTTAQWNTVQERWRRREQRRKDVVNQVRWILEHHNLYKLYYYPDPAIANDYMHPQHLVRRGGDNGGGGFKLIAALNNYNGLTYDPDIKQLVPGQRQRVRRLREVLNWYMADPRRISDLEEFEMVTLLVEEMFGTMSDYGPIPTDHPDFSTAPIPNDENYRVISDLAINAMWKGVEYVLERGFVRKYYFANLSRNDVLRAVTDDRLYFHNHQLRDRAGDEIVRTAGETEDVFRARYDVVSRNPQAAEFSAEWFRRVSYLELWQFSKRINPSPTHAWWAVSWRDAMDAVAKGIFFGHGSNEEQLENMAAFAGAFWLVEIFSSLARGLQEGHAKYSKYFKPREIQKMIAEALVKRNLSIGPFEDGLISKKGGLVELVASVHTVERLFRRSKLGKLAEAVETRQLFEVETYQVKVTDRVLFPNRIDSILFAKREDMIAAFLGWLFEFWHDAYNEDFLFWQYYEEFQGIFYDRQIPFERYYREVYLSRKYRDKKIPAFEVDEGLIRSLRTPWFDWLIVPLLRGWVPVLIPKCSVLSGLQ